MTVAVVVPVYRPHLLPKEAAAWNCYQRFLSRHDGYLLVPDGLAPEFSDLPRVAFDPACFADVASYSRLLLSPAFYRAFERYRFVLIFQLDCLVLADELELWCQRADDQKYDYLGAPWFQDPGEPLHGLSRVGNGGLSLRRVEACLRVLTGRGRSPLGAWRALSRPLPEESAEAPLGPRLRRRLRIAREVARGVGWYARHYTLNEDHFWSDRAHLFDRRWRVAPAAEGLRFAFERAPAYSFELTGGELPFGVHAWTRYEPDFWQRHLERLELTEVDWRQNTGARVFDLSTLPRS